LELSAAVGGGSPRKRSRDHTGGVKAVSNGRLGVRPARLARRSGEQAERLHGALRVLYRDYLTGGGLDSLRASSCHRHSSEPRKRRRSR
jgi:hypothetical protein